MNKVLIDTNVLVYAFVQDSIYHIKASNILNENENQLFVTTKNISEFFSVCSKLNIDLEKVFGFYEDLKRNCEILIPNQLSLQYFENLICQYKPKGNRVYYIEIVSLMLAYNIQLIATANIEDFKNIREINLIEIN